jgi:hypothetical protein
VSIGTTLPAVADVAGGEVEGEVDVEPEGLGVLETVGS